MGSSSHGKMISTQKAARLKPDAQWIRTRYQLLSQVKAEVMRLLGPETDDLRVYSERYEREFKGRWTVSSKPQMMAEIEHADIVFAGDFHALGHAQRTHTKILRALSSDRTVILALECFPRQSQKWLDQYSAGKIELDELKKKVRWDKTWGFPWENYSILVELAKKRGFRLLALNEVRQDHHPESLAVREKLAAEKIREAYIRHPGALIYVMFGDLHLARPHLPQAVRDLLSEKSKVRDLILHLNSERIYFQLAKRGQELTVDVVRLGSNRFCIMSSPPWVQWQSYLLHLEKAEDKGLERDGDDDEYDPTDQVISLAKVIEKDLGIDLKIHQLSVYSAEDNSVWQTLERHLRAKEREVARHLLALGRSFFIPANSTGYLAQTTVNHASGLAGQFVHAQLSGQKKTAWNFPSDFQGAIWSEAVAYFVSKLINHKRQSETLSDLKAQLAMAGPDDQGREAMKLAIDQSMTELLLLTQGRRRRLQARARRRASYLEAARILGGMLGEKLYLAYRSRKLSAKAVVQLLKRDVTARGFQDEYETIIRKISDALAHKGNAGLVHVKTKRERL